MYIGIGIISFVIIYILGSVAWIVQHPNQFFL